jgi:hypothetical protein
MRPKMDPRAHKLMPLKSVPAASAPVRRFVRYLATVLSSPREAPRLLSSSLTLARCSYVLHVLRPLPFSMSAELYLSNFDVIP